MPDLILYENLCEPTFTKNIVLSGTAPEGTTPSIIAELFWRWEDEPDMEPQSLGSVAAGHELAVPFDLKGRAIRIFRNDVTAGGAKAFADINQADQVVFQIDVPDLEDLTFDTGTDEVTVTIANNGGTGDIKILRQFGSDDYVEVGSVAYSATTFIDSPPIDGTYNYKLTQVGQDGESNVKSVDVSTVGGTTGTAPTDLEGDFDGVETTSLTWTNHGGTGDIVVERKTGSSAYAVVATLASSAVSHDDTVFAVNVNRTYYYRVSNTSVSGYSNEVQVFVPRL
jgi:hypothetical protein